MEYVSASNLVKQSSKQICYLRNNKKSKAVSKAMIKGNKLAEQKIKSSLIEMRGSFTFEDYLIFYCFDEITINKNYFTLIEHKNGTKIEDWFLEQAIVQLAFYTSLFHCNDYTLYTTASFLLKQNYEKHTIDSHNYKYKESILHINKKKYKVEIINAEKILQFYFNKLKASKTYDSAIDFDAIYKHKEYNILKKYIKIKAC